MIKYPMSFFNGTLPSETSFVDEVLDLTWSDLKEEITKRSWSPFTFTDCPVERKPHRRADNFKGTSFLAFDIDEGLTINEAKEILKGTKFMIATTKSHQKLKVSGITTKPACDRFRIIVLINTNITSKGVYKATWGHYSQLLGHVDQQCKDVARFYFKSEKVVYIGEGEPVEPIMPIQVERHKNRVNRAKPQFQKLFQELPATDQKSGRLYPSTQQFVKFGASKNWRTEFFKACMDLKEQNFSKEEAEIMLEGATKNFYGYLNPHDLNIIEDVYKNRTGKYNFRSSNENEIENYSQPKKAVDQNNSSFKPPSESELKNTFFKDLERKKKSMEKTYTFINSAFDSLIRIESGAITLVGAKTGAGKTTVNLNLVVSFLRDSDFKKKVLIISNEESFLETYSKIACLFLGIDWKKEYKNFDNPDVQIRVNAAVGEIQKTVTVVTSNDSYDTTRIEDVKEILEHVKSEPDGYALVILDYLQTVVSSLDPNLNETFKISKNLGTYLKKYSQDCDVPVIVFAQLYDEGNDKKDISTRVQNDRSFANHCHTIIEVRPNFEMETTEVVCHKQRWGLKPQWKVHVQYSKGLLVPIKSINIV